MRPTSQRTTGHPYGECVRASYATLLGIPLALIPRLDPGALVAGETQRARQQNWLAMLGLRLIEVPPDPAADRPLPPSVLQAVPPVYHLMGGLSPRDLLHQCVGFGGRLAWDPHPSRAGLCSVTSLGFLVPRHAALRSIGRLGGVRTERNV